MSNRHGDFVWYELMTPHADATRDFYEGVIGWAIDAAGEGDADYRMIRSGEGPVAGMLPLSDQMLAGGARPGWLGYIAVDDVDAMAASVTDAGGRALMPPADLPGVGRVAMLADPQGAPFYIIRPQPPEDRPDAESMSFSYEKPRVGHCAWNELATSDPDAALAFYAQRFGWVKDGEMDMGPMGAYQLLRHAGRAPEGSPPGTGMLGAVMPLPEGMPVPAWSHYFRVADIDAATAAVRAGGGTVTEEPVEIPGGDFSMSGIDPQGAAFALVGSRSK